MAGMLSCGSRRDPLHYYRLNRRAYGGDAYEPGTRTNGTERPEKERHSRADKAAAQSLKRWTSRFARRYSTQLCRAELSDYHDAPRIDAEEEARREHEFQMAMEYDHWLMYGDDGDVDWEDGEFEVDDEDTVLEETFEIDPALIREEAMETIASFSDPGLGMLFEALSSLLRR